MARIRPVRVRREHAAAVRLRLSPRAFYEAGVAGALCDDTTRASLRAIGDASDWAAAGSAEEVPIRLSP
jgi:aminodeoxyfutalosine deaminase